MVIEHPIKTAMLYIICITNIAYVTDPRGTKNRKKDTERRGKIQEEARRTQRETERHRKRQEGHRKRRKDTERDKKDTQRHRRTQKEAKWTQKDTKKDEKTQNNTAGLALMGLRLKEKIGNDEKYRADNWEVTRMTIAAKMRPPQFSLDSSTILGG